MAPAGLFARLQADAVVGNLNLEGSVCPDGEKRTDVGGLAGVNSGTVRTAFTGTVSGSGTWAAWWAGTLGTVKMQLLPGGVRHQQHRRPGGLQFGAGAGFPE